MSTSKRPKSEKKSPFDARTEAMEALGSPRKRAAYREQIITLEAKATAANEEARAARESASRLARQDEDMGIQWHEIVRLAFLEGKSIGDGYTDADAQQMWPHSASAELICWDEYVDKRDAKQP